MTEIRGDPIVAPGSAAGLAPDMEVEAVIEPATPEDPDWWAEEAVGEPLLVSFDQLAGFDYIMADPADEGAGTIPASIRSLDGRTVGVRGFMLPTRLEGGLTTGFLLMRDQSMCCFGVIPRINEWVEVTMAGRGVRPLMDQPVTVFGILRVGETYENGVLVGIYRMEGEEMAGPLDL